MIRPDAEELEAGPKHTASPWFGHDFGGIPIHPPSAGGIQTKLTINKPGDEFEREADRISERVMRTPESELQSACNCGGACPKCQTQRLDLGHARASSGQPLDRQTRHFMESRFGHDFSHVRVHTDSQAAEAARAVDALAYTVGHNVVFGAGQFSPQSVEGKRLLAHELTHVVQQANAVAAPPHLQRAPDKKQKRQDVVVLGEDLTNGEQLAGLLAPNAHIYRVKSLSEVAAALAKVDFPIGTLYFVAHSAPNGALQFGSKEGVIQPADLGSKLKSKISADNAPEAVDFRGCSVGNSPKAMDQIRTALGAKSVVAGDCFSIIDRSTPIKIGDRPITKKSDVKPENHSLFVELLNKTADKFGDKKKCILNRSEDGFFAAGGQFVVLWFNPTESTEWLPGKSVCYKDIAPETVDPNQALSASAHCRLIQVGPEASTKQDVKGK